MTFIRTVPSSAAVLNASTDVKNSLAGLAGVVESVQSEWNTLRAVYSTPEDETVFSVFTNLTASTEALSALLEAAAGALDTYASALQGLETERATLVAAVNDESETSDEASSSVPAFNTRVREADQECARALRALQLQGGTEVGGYLTDPFTVGSGTIGMAGSALEWHKGALLRFRDGAQIPPTLLKPNVPFDSWTKETFQGKVYGIDPKTGLMLPSSAAPPPEAPKITPAQVKAVPTPPPWAKAGAKGLGVLGAGVTLYGAWGTEYNESLIRHPEKTESEHQVEATKRAAVTGGFEVAGALGGAAVGASWGATVGTFIPIPVVGTVVGGVVGGLVGGLIGGFFGKKSGEKVEELVFD